MDWEKKGMRPYISKSGLKEYLSTQGYSEAKIRRAIDPSNGDGVVGALLLAKAIAPFEHGWIVVDDAWASQMMMAKYGDRNEPA